MDEKLLSVDYSLSRASGENEEVILDLAVKNYPHSSLKGTNPRIFHGGRQRIFAQWEEYPYTFHCNGIIRRDEFATHWKSLHVDIQLHSSEHIRRCPLRICGCEYGQNHLVPHPLGSTIHYDDERDVFSYVPATVCLDGYEASLSPNNYLAKIQEKRELALYGYGDEEEESYDIMGQLPIEVLEVIFRHLDSLSLWSLSQVNYYFRKVCFCLVNDQGIVYSKWEKDDASKLPSTRWRSTPKVRVLVYTV